jgi:glycosyltransferase involved in cell wall biosynthesis
MLKHHERKHISVQKDNLFPRFLALCGGMVIFGGLERSFFEVLRIAREQGWEVHCIVNDWENYRIVAAVEDIGASWSTGFYQHKINRTMRNPFKLIKLTWGVIKTNAGLAKDVWKFRPTIILVPEFVSVLLNSPILSLARLLKIKVILRLGNAPHHSTFYRRVWRWGVNPFVDTFISCSNDTEHALLAHGIPKRKSRVIYNVAPSRKIHETKGRNRDWNKIIFVGQIIPEKGLDLLIDAIGLLVARGYEVRLDVVGNLEGWVAPNYIGYREKLYARVNKPDLNGRVRFLGYQDDVPNLMVKSGIHCSPSRPEMLEGMPLVVIEAKQSGIPSIAFHVGPFPELINHGVDGWICSEVSPDALAEGIAHFLSDPQKLKSAGRSALLSAELFSYESFSRKWLEIILGQTVAGRTG